MISLFTGEGELIRLTPDDTGCHPVDFMKVKALEKRFVMEGPKLISAQLEMGIPKDMLLGYVGLWNVFSPTYYILDGKLFKSRAVAKNFLKNSVKYRLIGQDADNYLLKLEKRLLGGYVK